MNLLRFQLAPLPVTRELELHTGPTITPFPQTKGGIALTLAFSLAYNYFLRPDDDMQTILKYLQASEL